MVRKVNSGEGRKLDHVGPGEEVETTGRAALHDGTSGNPAEEKGVVLAARLAAFGNKLDLLPENLVRLQQPPILPGQRDSRHTCRFF